MYPPATETSPVVPSDPSDPSVIPGQAFRRSGGITLDPSIVATIASGMEYAIRKGAYNDVTIHQLHTLTGTLLLLQDQLPPQRQP